MSSVVIDASRSETLTSESAAHQSPLPEDRRAGVCMHVTSLPSRYGIGEIGHGAMEFIDSIKSMGLKVWQFLPLGPTAYGNSPYQPLSSFAGNELLIDTAGLIRMGLVKPSEAAELRELPEDVVDYGALIPVKNRLLGRAADRFEARASVELKNACEEFVEAHNELWLHDYALYRILKSRHGHRAWPEWDRSFVRREAGPMRRLEEFARDQVAEIKIIQFLFHHQWAELRRHATEQGILLFGDMPIYIAFDSADAWSHPEILRVDKDGRPDKVAGVPPDYFSEDGQLWGNPLYDWDHHQAQGYRWWIERMRHTMTLMDLVRVDHFRGFEAFWSVPADATTAKDGIWEPGPRDAIFEAMRQALGYMPIIAEDLGVITDEVDGLRERQQIPGMKVLQFEVEEADFDAAEIEDQCVCYTGTHDNDTTVGWFHGGPGDVRTPEQVVEARKLALRHTGGTADTIHLDLIRLGLETDARISLALMQDYLGLGSEARLNTPGTSGDNWRWRLQQEQLTPELRESIRQMVAASGRI